MNFAGVDIGSRTAKVAIMADNSLVSYHVLNSGTESAKAAAICMERALNGTGLTIKDLDYIATTGYGRLVAPFGQANFSDIAAHAMGASWCFPTVRTILDLGGQDSKAISCREGGWVTGFIMNDKCAAGTGRWLEIMADILEVPLEKLGELSLQSQKKLAVSSACAVFAKSELLCRLKDGAEKVDIISAMHETVAAQCYKMLGRIPLKKDFVITGGVAKNIGVVHRIKERVGMEPLIPPNPQIIGAVGACVLARHRFLAKQKAN